MKINTSSKNFEITEIINSKLETVLNKFVKFTKDDSVFDVNVEKTTNHHKKGDVLRVHILFNNAGKKFNVEAHGENIFDVIDEAAERLEREVKAGKEKKMNSLRDFGRKFKNLLKFKNE
jgi:ribosomal subunit interface protein